MYSSQCEMEIIDPPFIDKSHPNSNLNMRIIRKIKFYNVMTFVSLWANKASILLLDPLHKNQKILSHQEI